MSGNPGQDAAFPAGSVSPQEHSGDRTGDLNQTLKAVGSLLWEPGLAETPITRAAHWPCVGVTPFCHYGQHGPSGQPRLVGDETPKGKCRTRGGGGSRPLWSCRVPVSAAGSGGEGAPGVDPPHTLPEPRPDPHARLPRTPRRKLISGNKAQKE